VTEIPEARVGDATVLLGRAGDGASISTAEYGAWAGLSEYEVTCGMSKRVPRTYVGDPP
ncbi:MAG: alanine racemase, partial [Deltaproteobacteria bacterium]|nr:alanine racemase [Deltaproteobacteria bacterium]